MAHWALEGPETWEDRKKRKIERSRPFSNSGSPPATLSTSLPPASRPVRAHRRG